MASKYFGGVSGHDYSQNFVNIDKLLDVFVKTQESVGHKPTFEQDVPLSTKNDPEPEIKYKKKEENHNCGSCNKKCGSCSSSVESDKKVFIGEFEQSDFDEYDDESPYICEWCGALGYGSKYIPELCDSCNKCESCQEYIDEECGGCGYSVFQDGRYYREKISETELFAEDELEKFNSIKLDQKGEHLLFRDVFTVTKM